MDSSSKKTWEFAKKHEGKNSAHDFGKGKVIHESKGFKAANKADKARAKIAGKSKKGPAFVEKHFKNGSARYVPNKNR